MAEPRDNLRQRQTGEAKEKLFDNILNFRDVGKTINDFLGEKRVAEGKIFRSARPDDATMADRQRLWEEYGIKTIMDLRTVTEHTNAAKKRTGDLTIPALVQSNSALAEPIKIPGMNYLEININGKGFERSLLWQLKWWSFLKLITLMLFGYRMQAISILGREVMQLRGLIGLGYDSLDHCGPEIAEALRAFSRSGNLPMLAHCTQGKDRTGLIIALILFLLRVPSDAITNDYVLSESELLPERAERMKEISSIGLTEDFAGCPGDWVEKMEGHLKEKYGGVEGYCKRIGMEEEEWETLRGVLGY
ncbi:tyrosine/serine protein phosphatase-like protein [Mollisia scopiformis]|uniref:Tyrosine/serine protein phosphatase-like protein n=1 Tax=Mollisia scopiformis TaxID=149040 RepID=A0A194X5W1_MOLSC|nr:tyrosine/serine protein phosphatase-like protein [Mollisia scopiformis]KUJ15565.1 tyrosine/serine protein phosphatase-like protein [Mollisia scopiformis]